MNIDVDVLIIGTGVAGLYCALLLRNNLKVLLVSKSKVTETNTYLAQGGISTARDKEDIPLFISDTLKAGKYENNIDAVRILAEESIDNIGNIVKLGVKIDRDKEDFLFTREAAHSVNRIVHYKDKTGKALADALISEVRERENLTIYEDTYLIDILKTEDKCCGGILIKDNEQINVYSKVVVLATGGIGGIFNNSTNQRDLTADGICIAAKNNIQLKNLDYIQFHPTALHDEKKDARRFLISESVRGEGGKLINSKGERFVNELLPRDVVSEIIYIEMQKSQIPYVYLDISFLNKDYIINRFPTIYKECLGRGIDLTQEPIPVSPAQHYFMGGIETNLNAMTSMNYLFAVGEVGCTGVHGANRLASNSLLEGLVFSKRAANYINQQIDNLNIIHVDSPMIDISLGTIKENNKIMVINEFKRRTNLNDELFNY